MTPLDITVLLLVLGGFVYWTLHRSKDVPELAVKWAITLPVAAGMVYVILYWPGIIALLVGLVCAIAMSWIWTPSLGAFFAKPLADEFDGGDRPLDPEPEFGPIEANCKLGDLDEALRLARQELQKFPNEYRLHLQEAEILKKQGDPQAALTVFTRQLNRADLEVGQRLGFLHVMADLYLSHFRDRESARACFQAICDSFPDSEAAQLAAQRIAHLASTQMLVEPEQREAKPIEHRERYLGLEQPLAHELPNEENPIEIAEQYEQHLREHPLDAEVREKLARIYAGPLDQFDVGMGHLERLLALPHSSPKRIAQYINTMADLHVLHQRDYAAAHRCLQRLVEQFPGGAAAENAQRRQNLLKLEAGRPHERYEVSMKDREFARDIGLATAEKIVSKRRRATESERENEGQTGTSAQEG